MAGPAQDSRGADTGAGAMPSFGSASLRLVGPQLLFQAMLESLSLSRRRGDLPPVESPAQSEFEQTYDVAA